MMNVQDILTSTSFAALDDDGQAAVREYVWQFFEKGELPDLPLLDILKKKQSLPATLRQAEQQLMGISATDIHLLSLSKRLILEEDLLFAFFVLSAQYQLDQAQGYDTNARIAQINRCALLLEELHTAPEPGKQKTPKKVLESLVNDSDKPVKYLGLTLIAPFILNEARKLSNTQEKNLEYLASNFESKRRYWTWTGSLLSTVFSALSMRFAQTEQSEKIFSENAELMSYVNWIVLYAHLGIQLGAMTRHVLIGATDKENELSRMDRLTAEWQQRKYTIMQTSFTIAIGLMCTFWAVSNSPLAVLTGPLSILLRLLCVMLTVKQFLDKSAQNTEKLGQFDHDIHQIEDKIAELNDKKIAYEAIIHTFEEERKSLDALSEEQQQLWLERKNEVEHLQQALEVFEIRSMILESQLNASSKQKRKHRIEWYARENAMLIDLGLATGLLTGVCFMAAAFFPPFALAQSIGSIISLTGASVCFSAMISHTLLSGQTHIGATEYHKRSLNEECAVLLLQFSHCSNEDEKKLLYIDLLRLHAQSEFQRELIEFQKMQVLHKAMMQVLLPALIFTSFIFLPGAGVALIGIGLVLAIISEQYLERYRPKSYGIPDFDLKEYETFMQNPTLEIIKLHASQKINMERTDGNTLGQEIVGDEVDLNDNPLIIVHHP